MVVVVARSRTNKNNGGRQGQATEPGLPRYGGEGRCTYF